MQELLSYLCDDCPVRTGGQGPHRAECGDKRSEAFYRLVFKDNALEQVLPDNRAPLPDHVDTCRRLASLLGVRSTDPLMAWDGQVDSPEYHQVVERLKNWIARNNNTIKPMNDI